MNARQHRRGCCCVVFTGLLVAAWFGPAVASAGGTLYFSDIFKPSFSDGYIRQVDTDGTGLDTILDVGGGLRAIDLDVAAGKIYWTDVDNDVIGRCNLDGSGAEDVITTGLLFPQGIALNPPADTLYWGDQTGDEIGWANLDGTGAAPLLATSFHSGIAVDRVNGKLYWSTSITSAAGDIMRCNHDGTGVETVITGVDKPSRLALDVAGGKIYWTDYVVDVVRRANLNGTGVETIYTVGANLNPGGIALDLGEGKVYWGQSVQSNRMTIMRMDLDGSNPEDVVADLGSVSTIVFVPGLPYYGDLNCDGVLNAFDIDPFVLALTDPVGYEAAFPDCDRDRADCNQDGLINAFDIDPFVNLLTGG